MLINNRGKIILLSCLALIMALAPGFISTADTFPPPRGAVNDFAGVIDPANAARMETLAREVLLKTGTAVVVAIVDSIGENEDYNLYANKLYQAWGIGKKGEDKGVLIFLAIKERQIRIETGYGAEGILPDGLVGEILDKYVVPQLEEDNYGEALYNAMYACSAYIARDAGIQLSGAEAPYRPHGRAEKKGFNVFGFILFLIAAAFLLGTRTGRSMLPWILLLLLSGGRKGRGGGFSGGFGGGMSGGGGAGRSF